VYVFEGEIRGAGRVEKGRKIRGGAGRVEKEQKEKQEDVPKKEGKIEPQA
jgi:hypothetical protein